MMHDPEATFYGGYDQAGVGRLPSLRFSRIGLAIGVAAVALLLLIGSDVVAFDDRIAAVEVTSVNWVVGGHSIASTEGFTAHTSERFLVAETCQIFCYNFDGATVNPPFQLVGMSIVNAPVQYTNLTVRAPGSAYSGPLTITLEVG